MTTIMSLRWRAIRLGGRCRQSPEGRPVKSHAVWFLTVWRQGHKTLAHGFGGTAVITSSERDEIKGMIIMPITAPAASALSDEIDNQ